MLPSGRWQYLLGPMGLSVTSDDWCRKSNFVIQCNKNARKIVDDILCWGATMQELMTKLDTILSQVFYGRRMKTDAPIRAAALRARTDLSAAESARQRVSDSKCNSANSQSTTRPDMIAGQMVSVQNPTTKRWDKRGIIVEARNPRNRTFQVKVDGTIWTRSKIFLRPAYHIPLTDPFRALTGPPRAVCDLANFPPLAPPLPAPPRRSALVQERKARETAAGTVIAIFTQ
jgi:hypothetical protein